MNDKTRSETAAPAVGTPVDRGVGRPAPERNGWTQRADGLWAPPPNPENAPQPVRAWYMRDNHTFRALPLDVEAALAAMREERDAGHTYGMLCGRPSAVVPDHVHARDAARWPQFEAAARPWLEAVVEASKTPND